MTKPSKLEFQNYGLDTRIFRHLRYSRIKHLKSGEYYANIAGESVRCAEYDSSGLSNFCTHKTTPLRHMIERPLFSLLVRYPI